MDCINRENSKSCWTKQIQGKNNIEETKIIGI